MARRHEWGFAACSIIGVAVVILVAGCGDDASGRPGDLGATDTAVGRDQGRVDGPVRQDFGAVDGAARDGAVIDGPGADGPGADGSTADGSGADAAVDDAAPDAGADATPPDVGADATPAVDGGSADAAGDGAAGDGAVGDGATGDGPAGDGAAGDGPAGDGPAADGGVGFTACTKLRFRDRTADLPVTPTKITAIGGDGQGRWLVGGTSAAGAFLADCDADGCSNLTASIASDLVIADIASNRQGAWLVAGYTYDWTQWWTCAAKIYSYDGATLSEISAQFVGGLTCPQGSRALAAEWDGSRWLVGGGCAPSALQLLFSYDGSQVTDLSAQVVGLGSDFDAMPVARIASNGSFSLIAGGGGWWSTADWSGLMRLDGDVGSDINSSSGWISVGINRITDMAWVGDQWVLVGRYVTEPPPPKPYGAILTSADLTGFSEMYFETELGSAYAYFEPSSVSGNPDCALIAGDSDLAGLEAGALEDIKRIAQASAVCFDGTTWMVGGTDLDESL